MFFSGTDWEQLEDRAVISNYFMMLIVNKAEDMTAKVAFKAKVTGERGREIAFSNNTDGYLSLKLTEKTDEELLVIMDCNIERETGVVDAVFEQRYEAVKAAVEEESKNRVPITYKSWEKPKTKDAWDDRGWGETEEWGYKNGLYQKLPKEEKKISSMTDKEWNSTQDTGKKWYVRDAREFINALLTRAETNASYYVGAHYVDPMHKLDALNLTFKEDKEEMGYWVLNNIDVRMEDAFGYINPRCSRHDYVNLLTACEEYLRPYIPSNSLVKEIVDSIQHEVIEKWDGSMAL